MPKPPTKAELAAQELCADARNKIVSVTMGMHISNDLNRHPSIRYNLRQTHRSTKGKRNEIILALTETFCWLFPFDHPNHARIRDVYSDTAEIDQLVATLNELGYDLRLNTSWTRYRFYLVGPLSAFAQAAVSYGADTSEET